MASVASLRQVKMAAFKIVICLALAVAAVMAETAEPERVKKDVVVGAYPGAYPYAGYSGAYPYAAYSGAYPYASYSGAYPYAAYSAAYPYAAYDDGKYYPGKYEKPTVYAAPAVSYYKPSAYAAPVSYVKSAYSYPYSYPYTYPVV